MKTHNMWEKGMEKIIGQTEDGLRTETLVNVEDLGEGKSVKTIKNFVQDVPMKPLDEVVEYTEPRVVKTVVKKFIDGNLEVTETEFDNSGHVQAGRNYQEKNACSKKNGCGDKTDKLIQLMETLIEKFDGFTGNVTEVRSVTKVESSAKRQLVEEIKNTEENKTPVQSAVNWALWIGIAVMSGYLLVNFI